MRVTFAEPEVKMCLKVVIVLFDRVDRNLAQMLPGLAVFRVAVLQLGGNLPRFFLGGFVFLAADVDFFVKGADGLNVISFPVLERSPS